MHLTFTCVGKVRRVQLRFLPVGSADQVRHFRGRFVPDDFKSVFSFHNMSFPSNNGQICSSMISILAIVLLARVKYLVLISLLCFILCSRCTINSCGILLPLSWLHALQTTNLFHILFGPCLSSG